MARRGCREPEAGRRKEVRIRVTGNTSGLKASPLRRLEKLANRRSKADSIVAPELARALTEVSQEIQRQVGILIDRRGHIRVVMVGDARSVFIPDLSAYRRGRDRLLGLRLVHTHLNHEPLNDDDFTDLALLRLDLVASVEVLDSGLPGQVNAAHLLPENGENEPYRVLPPQSVHDLPPDFRPMMEALEDEFNRVRRTRKAAQGENRAILAHVSQQPASQSEDSLAELRELCRSAGISVLDHFSQRRPVDPRYVMGKGKLKQIIIRAMQVGAEVLVFDMDLSPSQIQNLANYTDLKILDRTQVILDIFAQHAQTREGKLQVELAQLRYMLPRLSEKHTAMSRLTGGIGGRGPGETKLEIDRRRVKDRIAQLEREIDKLGNRRELRRRQRTRNNLPIASIVGYTNAGKSTLLNSLTDSNVTQENALFATLNPVTRRLRFPEEREIIITDTVGFIRDLPADLRAAFRTTLEELDEADLLVHVLDASSPAVEEQLKAVQDILGELALGEKPCLLVWNKIDQADPEVVEGLRHQYGGIAISALDKKTFEPLNEQLESLLWPETRTAMESY